MSILLINTVGFVVCSAIVVIGAKSVYHASQVVPYEEDYDVEIPLEDRNITADVVGVGVEIARFGNDVVESLQEKIFDSRPVDWIRIVLEHFQLKADGEYFRYKEGQEDEFEGWAEDSPNFNPGKHEVDM